MSDDSDDAPQVLYAQFTASAGNEEQVAALVRGYADLVRAEPGNLLFSASRKRDEPAAFFVYEEYRDAAAFAAHRSAEYGAIFNRALADLIVESGSQLTFLRSV